MKKFFLLLLAFSGMIFALTDTDSDGITDEKDICPRVYARSTNGCPTLTVSSTPVSVNSCLNAQKKIGKNIVTLTPICDFANKVCPQINNILWIQSCDPVFPVIFDATGSVLVRGSVYIVDYTD